MAKKAFRSSIAVGLAIALAAVALPPVHNPSMGDGIEQVKVFLEKLGLQNAPKFKVEFLRVAADGDLVFIQTRQPKMGNNPEMVIVDIFRVAKGKIAEHWDVMQPVPADAGNKRPMY